MNQQKYAATSARLARTDKSVNTKQSTTAVVQLYQRSETKIPPRWNKSLTPVVRTMERCAKRRPAQRHPNSTAPVANMIKIYVIMV